MPKILRISVYNRPGVVDRITGIIRRNGWNISGINAGEMYQDVSQINLLLRQRNVDIKTLGNHLDSLDCVREWEICTPKDHFIRELFAFTIRSEDYSSNLLAGARVVEKSNGITFLEYTASPAEIDAAIEKLGDRVIHCARTGVLSLSRSGER